MSISGITSGSAYAPQGAGGRLYLPGAAEFADKLTVGQILKGRVLRHYDDSNRYLVDFNGDSRVVDSAVPLSTGELLHGRVVGLGDRVELQRIAAPDENTGRVPSPGETALPKSTDPLSATLSRFNVTLDATDQTALSRAMRSVSDGSAMSIAGVLLNKLGLSQSPELLNAVYTMLVARREPAKDQSAIDLHAVLGSAAAATIPPAAIVAQLGEMLKQTLEESVPQAQERTVTSDAEQTAQVGMTEGSESQAGDGDKATGSGTQDAAQWLGQWVLNAQTEGSVAHRSGTIPLLIGDRLMEVDVALFEQKRNAGAKGDARHRHLVFRLNTDSMGTVEISARVSGDRVRVQVLADDERAVSILSGESAGLRAALTEAGWQMDEATYGTKEFGDRNAATSAVIDHVVNQGLLNRVV